MAHYALHADLELLPDFAPSLRDIIVLASIHGHYVRLQQINRGTRWPIIALAISPADPPNTYTAAWNVLNVLASNARRRTEEPPYYAKPIAVDDPRIPPQFMHTQDRP